MNRGPASWSLVPILLPHIKQLYPAREARWIAIWIECDFLGLPISQRCPKPNDCHRALYTETIVNSLKQRGWHDWAQKSIHLPYDIYQEHFLREGYDGKDLANFSFQPKDKARYQRLLKVADVQRDGMRTALFAIMQHIEEHKE